MHRFFLVLLLLIPTTCWADGQKPSEKAIGSAADSSEFKLGGAATGAARHAPDPIIERVRRPALRLPLLATEGQKKTERPFGAATVFLSESLEIGREAVQMGTFVQRGSARAGLSVTFLDAQSTVSRSTVFLDYALTDRFTVGLSGILDNDQDSAEPVQQFGLNAAFSSENGTFVQGGLAGAADYRPVVGLSVGLKF